MEVACTAKRNFDRECKKTFATKSAQSCPQPKRRDVRSWRKRTFERRNGEGRVRPTRDMRGSRISHRKSTVRSFAKADIVSLLHAHDLRRRVAWQSTSDGENSYSHWASRRRHGRSRRARS